MSAAEVGVIAKETGLQIWQVEAVFEACELLLLSGKIRRVPRVARFYIAFTPLRQRLNADGSVKWISPAHYSLRAKVFKSLSDGAGVKKQQGRGWF